MKNFLKSPWTISITTAVFSFFLTVIYDIIKKKQLLSTMKAILLSLQNGFVAFLNYELKVWWILLGIVALFLLLLIISGIKNGEGKDNKPDFIDYTEDHFGDWKWSWEWRYNTLKATWYLSQLKAHCPKCDTPMFLDSDGYLFRCPRCGFVSYQRNGYKKSYDVHALIIDNLNRKRKAKHETEI